MEATAITLQTATSQKREPVPRTTGLSSELPGADFCSGRGASDDPLASDLGPDSMVLARSPGFVIIAAELHSNESTASVRQWAIDNPIFRPLSHLTGVSVNYARSSTLWPVHETIPQLAKIWPI
jgi:hypothetical protein